MSCFRFTPIIICHFTLNLRQVKSPGSSWVSGSRSASLHFVGNAGGSLHFGGDDEEEGEDAVEQPGQAEGSGALIVDKEEHGSTSVTGHYPAGQSVSVLSISEKKLDYSPYLVKGKLLTASTIVSLAFRYSSVIPHSNLACLWRRSTNGATPGALYRIVINYRRLRRASTPSRDGRLFLYLCL